MKPNDCGEVGPWEKTPWWNPRALVWPMRRWITDHNFHIGDDYWEYATYGQCAREVLEDSYG